MKRLHITLLFAFLVSMSFMGCKPDGVSPNSADDAQVAGLLNEVVHEAPDPICGPNNVLSLVSPAYGTAYPMGTAQIVNGEENLYIGMRPNAGLFVKECAVWVGEQGGMPPMDPMTGNMDRASFGYQNMMNPVSSLYSYNIPLQDLNECNSLVVWANLVIMDANGAITFSTDVFAIGAPVAGGFTIDYCNQTCASQSCQPWQGGSNPCNVALPTCSGVQSGAFRTQTQGGWGSGANGNNPGVYRDANFAAAFPNGLVVGCSSGATLSLTSSAAVEAFLPAGGKSAPLNESKVNPTGKQLKNALAGQLVALSLSTGFDNYDVNYSSSVFPLKELKMAAGTFAGYKVAEIEALGNDILGGCSSAYRPSELTAVISVINENFVDGTRDGGDLVCP